MEGSREHEIELRDVLNEDLDNGRVAISNLQLCINEASKMLGKVG